MPATAGRVRMPANNRMQTSNSLNTHGIWQNAIGYDPYAGEKDTGASAAASTEAGQNAYENMKGLLALARQTHGAVHGQEDRGGWKGSGKLRGGWAAGKDLGYLPKEAEGAADAMPSSTSSETDEDEDDDALAGGYYGHLAAPSTDAPSAKRPREESRVSEKKSKKHKDKDKKHKDKKHKKKEKKHKKDKSHKRSRHSER